MHRRLVSRFSNLKNLNCGFNQTICLSTQRVLNPVADDDALYADVPKPRRNKSERKPYPTPMKTLIRRAKEERAARKAQPCRLLEHPPENGLLVPQLVAVAHQVHQARESLLLGVSKLLQVLPLQRCTAMRFMLAKWVMRSEPAQVQIVVFEVLNMYGEKEEFKMWFSSPNASIFSTVLENQE